MKIQPINTSVFPLRKLKAEEKLKKGISLKKQTHTEILQRIPIIWKTTRDPSYLIINGTNGAMLSAE